MNAVQDTSMKSLRIYVGLVLKHVNLAKKGKTETAILVILETGSLQMVYVCLPVLWVMVTLF